MAPFGIPLVSWRLSVKAGDLVKNGASVLFADHDRELVGLVLKTYMLGELHCEVLLSGERWDLYESMLEVINVAE